MHSPDVRAPALAVWALGVTQIIGYGTLFYSFAILAPAMSADLDLPEQWVFGALSLALFLGSLLAPTAGRMADRHGAGRVMTVGSAAAALALAACALAPERFSFVAALVAMELASCFVLYATAFVAIVQIGPAWRAAQHHPPDPDRRLRLDDLLAGHHLAARLPRLARGLLSSSPG